MDSQCVRYGHPQCYAKCLGDCSRSISREHYVSESILNRISTTGGLLVSGMPWQAAGAAQEISPNGLASKILCEKHNSVLSDLDAAALNLFGVLDQIGHDIGKVKQGSIGWVRTFEGTHIERWLLKVTLGVVAAGLARGINGVQPKWEAMDHWVEILFGRYPVPQGCGLYVVRRETGRLTMEQGILFAPRVDDGLTRWQGF